MITILFILLLISIINYNWFYKIEENRRYYHRAQGEDWSKEDKK